MRHYNPTHCLPWRNNNRPYVCSKPQHQCYSYAHPTMKRWYVKILQYVYDHPNCKRVEILHGVFPTQFESIESAKKYGRGYASITFSNMLYDDLIDYDSKYRYVIRPYGLEVLKRAYIADLASQINGNKAMLTNSLMKI